MSRRTTGGGDRSARRRRTVPWVFIAALVALVAVGATSRSGGAGRAATTPAAALQRNGAAPPARQVQVGGVTDPSGAGATPTASGTGTTVPGPAGPPSIGVITQDPWIGPRGTFRLQVAAVTPDEGYVLDARLYRAVPTAETVLATGPEALPSRSLGLLTEVDLPKGSTSHRIEVPVVPEADGTFGDPYVLDPGVFPIRLRLLDPEGRTVSNLVTHLVHLPPSLLTEPAGVAVVADLRVGPTVSDDGTRAGGRAPGNLEQRLDALGAYSGVPMSLRLHPETVAGLTASRTGSGGAALSDLVRLAGTTASGRAEVLRSTFVGFDEAAWLADQHPELVQGELDLASVTLASAGLRVADATVALQGRPDAPLLAELASYGVSRVVAPGADGDGREVHLGRGPGPVPQQPGRWLLPGPTLGVGPAATPTGRATGSSDGEAGLGLLDAHRVLAALLVGPIEGDRADQQLRLGTGIDFRGPFTTELLGALASKGPLRAATVSELFEGARSGSPAPVEPVPDSTPPGRSQPRSDRLTTTSVRVEGVRSLLGDDDLATVLSMRLLVVPARDLSDADADAVLAEVDAAVTAVTDDIVLPDPKSFTTTSHETSIPLVIRNESSQVLRVDLQLTSSELEFRGPNPRSIELRPGPNDLEIPIKTRRSGEFDFGIRVTSPDGNLTVGDIDVEVQSRAISGVGLFLSSGALAYLLVWWFRNTRRRRAAPPPAPPAGGPSADGSGEPDAPGGADRPVADDGLSPVGAEGRSVDHPPDDLPAP